MYILLFGSPSTRTVIYPSLPGSWVFQKCALLLVHGTRCAQTGALVDHAFALSPAARVARTLSPASGAFGTIRRFDSRGPRRKGLGRRTGKRCSILTDARRGLYWEGREWLRHGLTVRPRRLVSLAESGGEWRLQIAQGHEPVSFWQSDSRGFNESCRLLRTHSEYDGALFHVRNLMVVRTWCQHSLVDQGLFPAGAQSGTVSRDKWNVVDRLPRRNVLHTGFGAVIYTTVLCGNADGRTVMEYQSVGFSLTRRTWPWTEG